MTTTTVRIAARQGSGRYGLLLWQLWLPVVAFVLVWVISAGSTSFYFPPASRVAEVTVNTWFWEGIRTEMVPSLVRLVIGYGLAVVVGVALGVALGILRPLESATRPVVETVRAVPGVALLPIAMMFFGTGEVMKITMIAFISLWPIFLNTVEGVRSIDPTLTSVVRVYRLSPFATFRFVYLPAALPQIFAGARIALAIAVAVMVAVEMFGTPGGLGYFIRNAQQTFRIAEMWSGLLMLGIFGYLLNIAFRLLEHRVLRWNYRRIAHLKGSSQ